MLAVPTVKASKIDFDERRWPIVVVKLPSAPLSSLEFERYVDDVARYYERGESFGLVFDIRIAPAFSAAQRRLIAERIDRDSARHPDVAVCVSVVIESAVQRGIVKAITWLTRQPAPTHVVGDVEEGVSWISRRLRAPSRKKNPFADRSS